MNNFAKVMESNPPRLVVLFQRGEDGSERFQWGIVGGIPVLTLVGCLSRVIGELPLIEPCDLRRDCPESALVITWHEGRCEWFVHRDTPIDPLVGMLETIQFAIIGGGAAQRAAAQRVLGPDGGPVRKGLIT